MAEGPAWTLIGVGAIGFGALLAYGAYRNVPILGPDGLLTLALTKGSLKQLPLDEHPGFGFLKAPSAVTLARIAISAKDSSLGQEFDKHVNDLTPIQRDGDLMQRAAAKGVSSEAQVIQLWLASVQPASNTSNSPPVAIPI